jgi:hypothetical protein
MREPPQHGMLPDFPGNIGQEVPPAVHPPVRGRCGQSSQREELKVPDNVMLHLLPPYSPELNPQENLWDEIREKIFKNYALKSMEDVYAKLEQAALYIERNPAIVNPSRPSLTSSDQSDMEAVLDARLALRTRQLSNAMR